MVQVAGCSTL